MVYERQAITNNDVPPREQARPIHCWNCGNKRGAAAPSGVVVIRYKRREIVAKMPLGITCEECGERTVLARE
jgi:DNA-directed RNA polymerase subunit RPC12/RpoP